MRLGDTGLAFADISAARSGCTCGGAGCTILLVALPLHLVSVVGALPLPLISFGFGVVVCLLEVPVVACWGLSVKVAAFAYVRVGGRAAGLYSR